MVKKFWNSAPKKLNNYFKPPCGTQDNHKTEEFLQFLGYLYAILRNEAINQKMHQLHTILFSAQQVFKRSSHSAHIINRKVIYTIPFKVMTKYSHSHFQVQWRPENQLSVISLSLSAGARGSSTWPLSITRASSSLSFQNICFHS